MNILGPAGSITRPPLPTSRSPAFASGFNEQQTALAQTHGRLVDAAQQRRPVARGRRRLSQGGRRDDARSADGDRRHHRQRCGARPRVRTTWSKASASSRWSRSAARRSPSGSSSTSPPARSATTRSAAASPGRPAVLFRTIDGFAVRGTYSTAFRAPSINELYPGKADSVPATSDPCDTKPRGTLVTLDPAVAARRA